MVPRQYTIFHYIDIGKLGQVFGIHPTHELLKIAIMGILEPFCYPYHDAVTRVKPDFKRLREVIFSLEFLINFLNKFKYLNSIKPYIKFLDLKISLNRRFPWNISHFSQFSQSRSEMHLEVGLLKL